MAYTSNEIMVRFREDVDDKLPPDENDAYCLWSNKQVADFLTQAQREFCERTNYLTKELKIPVVTGQKEINFDDDIIKVRGARLETANKRLRILNGNDDQYYTDKDYGFSPRDAFDDSTGIPVAVLFDLILGKIHLHPIPSQDDTLWLNVVLASGRVTLDDNYVDVRHERYVDQAILPYMKYLAYSVQDADSYDPNKADKFFALADLAMSRVAGRVNKSRRKPRGSVYGGIV